jgi:hypothetical protein
VNRFYNWFGKTLAKIAFKTNSDYLKDCVDNFYDEYISYGYSLEFHWQWIRLPIVKNFDPLTQWKIEVGESISESQHEISFELNFKTVKEIYE